MGYMNEEMPHIEDLKAPTGVELNDIKKKICVLKQNIGIVEE